VKTPDMKQHYILFLLTLFFLGFFDLSAQETTKKYACTISMSQFIKEIQDTSKARIVIKDTNTLKKEAYIGFKQMLNAMALSMNAFVTLGYGDMPARGVARYLAVFEGLTGWFLLSIFSASLISQILQ
jgi:Ion channel